MMAALVAAIVMAFSGNHSGQWIVEWSPGACRPNILCKMWFQTEPNYGQAVVLAHKLEREGYRVKIVSAL